MSRLSRLTLPRFTLPRLTIIAAALTLLPGLALAQGIAVIDGYLRSSSPSAPTAAAFLRIENSSGLDDRLIGVATDAAEQAMLHTTEEDSNGVVRMTMRETVDLPAGSTYVMRRAGDHVMLMGLNAPLVDGDVINLILTFETAGEIKIAVPVDQTRQTDPGTTE